MAKADGERFKGDITRNAAYAKAAGSLLNHRLQFLIKLEGWLYNG